MSHTQYIFDRASDAPELRRLRLIESAFDEKTRQLLLSTGLLLGKHCLEVGAGAGSIAEWLSREAGPTGRVTAVDTNVRFLRPLSERIEVVEGQVGVVPLPVESYDLVHARYVLIHNADARPVLAAMVRALKPGGVLLLEEPDFGAAAAMTGPPHLRLAFENVKQATRAMFSSRGMNYAFGREVAALLPEDTLSIEALEYDCPVDPGKSKLAEVMRRSTDALEEEYIATGCATELDIARYGEFSQSPDCRGVYYATVRVVARKRAE